MSYICILNRNKQMNINYILNVIGMEADRKSGSGTLR